MVFSNSSCIESTDPEIVRTVALLRLVAQRLGVSSRFKFGVAIDAALSDLGRVSHTQSGHWYGYIDGLRPLSRSRDKLLDSLCELFPDAADLYQEGPADLWRAMWGDPGVLWQLCRTRVSNHGSWDDDAIWSQIESGFIKEKTVGDALCEFEKNLLRVNANDESLTLRHLTEAVALYRLHQFLNSVAPSGLNGVGAYRCVSICLDDVNIWWELHQLGVFHSVRDMLTEIEIGRLSRERSYRLAVGIESHQIALYADDPLSWI
ncbi:hypothetical protein V8G57_13805 [Collimonas sp. H4R21]|uniref:Uncharacterized protein n=1 Tax=Collimonas rhizosphaerae TaxID=3126357 RepID=A0ABU9PWS5_9BURK